MADLTRLDVPALATLRERYCQDVRRLKQRAGVTNPNVAPGSETYIKGEAIAAATQQIMAREVALQDATMPDRATDDDLDRLAATRGVTRSTGAGATGNVIVSTTGAVAFAAGIECKTDDGLRYAVAATTIAADGDAVPIVGVDVGTRTNRIEGTILTWTSPPAGSDATAEVAAGGLVNGTDADNDARLRLRLLDAIRHPQQAGSWANYAAWAEANASVAKAFVYPAARGPATVDVAIMVTPTSENVWSPVANAALVSDVATYVVGEDPEHVDVVVRSVAAEPVNVALRVQAPLPLADGGTGGGWIDGASIIWPTYCTTSPHIAHLNAAPTSPTLIQVDCVEAGNAPVAESHFAIWSSSAKKWLRSRVKSSALVGGVVYNVTLYDPIDTSACTVGDYLSPDAEKLDDYAATMLAQFATLGPGEETTTAALLPRASRRPVPHESWPSQLTSANIGALSVAHHELAHVVAVVPTLPSTPTVASPPQVLTMGHLAFAKY